MSRGVGARGPLRRAIAGAARAPAVAWWLLALAPWPLAAQVRTDGDGEAARTLDTVDVVGQRRPLAAFPGAVSIIPRDALRDGQRAVSLADALSRVPGVTALDRQNYAQDLQVQSRGFGARSTFGIRGIKLVVDGIPSSAPDGQGQAANFPIDALDRIEVLRGPLALQYGNAAGGAIVGYTDVDAADGVAFDGWSGSDASRRAALRWNGSAAGDALRWQAHGSHFRTDGERPHSAAERAQFDAVLQWTPSAGGRLRLVANLLAQPTTQDPLGLTRDGLRADPHGTDPVALQFNTRKRIGNHQFGLRWEHDYAPGRSAWAGAWRIERDVLQYLALPVGAQVPPGSAGGVIDLARSSTGIDVGHRWHGARATLALGIEAGRLDEARAGYENFVGAQLGVRGRLRRDEDNRIDNREAYAIADLRLSGDWTLLAAVRHARLAFRSDDHFVAPGNGDDSGRLDYAETSASAGIARAFGRGELFASVGRGFETPTVTELAYRPDGSAGFNAELTPARFDSGEVGARLRIGAQRASIAAYRVDGDGEIVPAVSSGGRASFANAAATRRDGVELGLSGPLVGSWSYVLAANWIRARFTRGFAYDVVIAGTVAVREVEAGNRIPGIPHADGFAELAWRAPGDRFDVALEARGSAPIVVDDRNTDETAGNVRVALRAAWRPPRWRGWHAFARIDNLFDRDHVGSVIVNEGNARYFEPGAGRAFTLGLGWQAPAP